MLNTAMLAFGNLCGAISALCLLWLVLRTGEKRAEKKEPEWHREPPARDNYCTVEDVHAMMQSSLPARAKRVKRVPPAVVTPKAPPVEAPDWLEIS